MSIYSCCCWCWWCSSWCICVHVVLLLTPLLLYSGNSAIIRFSYYYYLVLRTFISALHDTWTKRSGPAARAIRSQNFINSRQILNDFQHSFTRTVISQLTTKLSQKNSFVSQVPLCCLVNISIQALTLILFIFKAVYHVYRLICCKFITACTSQRILKVGQYFRGTFKVKVA